MSSHIKNVAIVGAGGNLGSLVTKSLIEANRFNITIVSRAGSKSTFPTGPSVTVKHGDYNSSAFLVEAFSGNDAVIFTLHWSAVPDLEIEMIEAAAKAGVKWILPTEFGNDNGNETLSKALPTNVVKAPVRKRIEQLGEQYPGLKWMGIINNPWFEFCLKDGLLLIDIEKKTANLLNGGGKFNTTTMPTVGLAVARLLSLPLTSTSGPSLADYGNKFVYVRSFLVTQREILDAVQRVTKTTDADWTITHTDVQSVIEEGKAKLAQGDMMTGMKNLLVGNTLKEGAGGDYESTRGVSNAVLGLPEENLDEVVKEVLA